MVELKKKKKAQKKFEVCSYCRNRMEEGCKLNISVYGNQCSAFGPCFGERGNFKKYMRIMLSRKNNGIPSYVKKAYEKHYLECMRVCELLIDKYFLVVNMGKIFFLNGITEENQQLNKLEKLMETVMLHTIDRNTYITEDLYYVCIDEIDLSELGKRIEEAFIKEGFNCSDDCITAYTGFYAKGNPVSKNIDDLMLHGEQILLSFPEDE